MTLEDLEVGRDWGGWARGYLWPGGYVWAFGAGRSLGWQVGFRIGLALGELTAAYLQRNPFATKEEILHAIFGDELPR